MKNTIYITAAALLFLFIASTGRAADSEIGVQAKILHHGFNENMKSFFLLVDRGSDSGIDQGNKYSVYSGDKLLGEFEVQGALPESAVGAFIPKPKSPSPVIGSTIMLRPIESATSAPAVQTPLPQMETPPAPAEEKPTPTAQTQEEPVAPAPTPKPTAPPKPPAHEKPKKVATASASPKPLPPAPTWPPQKSQTAQQTPVETASAANEKIFDLPSNNPVVGSPASTPLGAPVGTSADVKTSWKYGANTTAHRQSDTYLVGPGDVLKIETWPKDLLPNNVTVRPDGTVNLPFTGSITVENKTPFEIADMLLDAMTQDFKRPWVEVTVSEYNANVVRVVGEIYRNPSFPSGPGQYPIRDDLHLFDFLSSVGGFTDKSDLANVSVIRKDGSKIAIDVTKIIANPKSPDNILLMPGDIIYVPALSSAP